MRRLFPGEAEAEAAAERRFLARTSRALHDCELQVLVRQTAPGQRLKLPFFRKRAAAIPDREEHLHALFDLMVDGGEYGREITSTDVEVLARKYAGGFDGGGAH